MLPILKSDQMISKEDILINFKEEEFNGLSCIDNLKLNEVYMVLRFLVGNKVQRILGFLRGNELNVTELMIKLRDMEQSEISRFLSDLRKYNIVYYEVKGKAHYYRVNQFMVKRINKAVNKL